MNTERVAEWNMWYHVLNSGFRVAVSGETDFPCMSGERVGIGRVYAKVDGELTFEKWVQSIADGRSYVSDGSCHLLDFLAVRSASDSITAVGVDESTVHVEEGEEVEFRVIAAARHDGSPEIPVELIVNGYPVDHQMIVANGDLNEVSFKATIPTSSWVAIRVFPNAHTNPIYVIADGKPVRGSVDSLRWCLAGVEQCWKSKQSTYAEAEQEDAKAAYDHARSVFEARIEEAEQNRTQAQTSQ